MKIYLMRKKEMIPQNHCKFNSVSSFLHDFWSECILLRGDADTCWDGQWCKVTLSYTEFTLVL